MYSEKELMLAGELYTANDPELIREMKRAKKLTRLINRTSEEKEEYRLGLFRKLLGKTGEEFWIEPPFHCDYGSHISVGNHFYANYDCIMIDVCDIKIGDNVFLGPRVCIYTAGHPIDANVRNMQLEYGKKVTIGNDVWICGNTVVNPGITIRDNVVIGSGSVVTKDIPSGVVAAGNPCRILREITTEDQIYWKELEQRYRKRIKE